MVMVIIGGIRLARRQWVIRDLVEPAAIPAMSARAPKAELNSED